METGAAYGADVTPETPIMNAMGGQSCQFWIRGVFLLAAPTVLGRKIHPLAILGTIFKKHDAILSFSVCEGVVF